VYNSIRTLKKEIQNKPSSRNAGYPDNPDTGWGRRRELHEVGRGYANSWAGIRLHAQSLCVANLSLPETGGWNPPEKRASLREIAIESWNVRVAALGAPRNVIGINLARSTANRADKCRERAMLGICQIYLSRKLLSLRLIFLILKENGNV